MSTNFPTSLDDFTNPTAADVRQQVERLTRQTQLLIRGLTRLVVREWRS